MRIDSTGWRLLAACLPQAALLSATMAVVSLPSFAAEDGDADKPAAKAEAADEQEKAKDAPAKPAVIKPIYNAKLRLQYDYRELGDEKDNDLYAYFYGDVRNLNNGRADFYVSARLKSDLDSDDSSASLADDPFRSVDESNGVTENRIRQLYLDLHDRDRVLAFRAGRQYIDIADYLHLDGGQVILKESGDLGGRIYAGAPVSYYNSDVSDDLAGGVSFIGRPWEGNRTRLTLARYHDEAEGEDDQNYYLDVRQQLTEAARTRGQLSVLNDEFRMGRLDGFFYAPSGETDFSIGASYWGSFDAKTRAYSPLYDTLGEQDPYTYAYARLNQQLAPKWTLSPGVSMRFADAGDNGQNNRDYENYDLALSFEPTRAFSATAALEYWAVEEGDSFFGVSGDVRYRSGRVWEVSGGMSFAEYNYDTYSDISYTASGGQAVFSDSGTIIEESPYVKTYFVRSKWKVNKRLTLRAQVDVEDDDSQDDLALRGRGSVEVRL
jgi:hypothetical protein